MSIVAQMIEVRRSHERCGSRRCFSLRGAPGGWVPGDSSSCSGTVTARRFGAASRASLQAASIGSWRSSRLARTCAGAFEGLRCSSSRTPTPRATCATSVQIGLEALGADPAAVLICLADHPLVRPETIRALASEHAARPAAILAPAWRGRRGHPVLFPREALDGDRRGAHAAGGAGPLARRRGPGRRRGRGGGDRRRHAGGVRAGAVARGAGRTGAVMEAGTRR